MTTVTYTPDLTIQYYLTDDDFMPFDGGPVKITRKRQADAFNQVLIECLDRSNNYNTCVVDAKDQANIEEYGLRPMQLLQLHAICVPSVAQNVAQLILNRALYIRNQYEFILGWKYARLEPMDLVAITDTDIGLNQYPVRITEIQENENGDLSITAEDFIGGNSTTALTNTQNSSGYSPNDELSAGNCVAPIIFQPPITLTQTPEIWLATCGQSGSNWGGAQIWASNDGSSYQQVGIVLNPSRMGVIASNVAIGADPDTVNNIPVDLTESSGDLISATSAQADAGTTLSYLDGEIIAYSNANLTANFNYTLDTYIRRGLYQSPISSHANGTNFLRLDDAVVSINLNKAWIGTPLYIKLLSYNNVGKALQALSDVNAHIYTPISEGLTPADGILALIDSSQQMTIPSGYQYNVANRLTIYGRVINFGQIRVIP